MIIKDCISANYPTVTNTESPLRAFDLMKEHQIKVVPILVENSQIYLGVVSEQAILNDIGAKSIIDLLTKERNYAVLADNSILQGIRLLESSGFDIVPVVDSEHHLLGVCTKISLFHQLSKSLHIEESGTVLLLLTERQSFALSHLTRIVEQESCVVLAAVTSAVTDEDSLVRICVKFQGIETSKAISALRRHGYVIESVSDSDYDEEYSEKADAFLHYLSI
jgi:CBS-domain-containing membrane protein